MNSKDMETNNKPSKKRVESSVEGKNLKEKKKMSPSNKKGSPPNRSIQSKILNSVDFEDQQKRLQKFEKLANELTKEKVSLQSQLTMGKEEKIQLEQIVDLLQKEKNHAVEKRNELEILLKESDAYGKTLREHVDELEQMGTTYHRQRDEQNEYFIQKELNLKVKAKSQLAAALNEIEELKRELSSHRDQKHILQDELELIRNEKDELLTEKYDKKKERESLRQRLKALENDVEIEQETVKMLSDKNSKLSSRLAIVESDLAKSKNKFTTREGHLSTKEIGEIDELLKNKTQIHHEEIKLRDQQILDLSQKVAKTEAELSKERRSKQEATSRISALENEVSKLKKSSEILISYTTRKTHKSKSPTASLLYNSYLMQGMNRTLTSPTPSMKSEEELYLKHYDLSPPEILHSTPHNLSKSSDVNIEGQQQAKQNNEKLDELSIIENCS